MTAARLRRLAARLRRTPLHPQWFVLWDDERRLAESAALLRGVVLDIGCADKRLQRRLGPECRYLGLDYPPVATARYGTRPDLFADGQRLPIATGAADSVALLDVLEHLREPERCIGECARVLRRGGVLVVQVPFLYPLHDVPYDFGRWTVHGLAAMLERHGFEIREHEWHGRPAESAALLGAIALAKGAMAAAWPIRPRTLLVPLLVTAIPLVNLAGWLMARLLPADDFMPHGCRVVAIRR